jgi:phage terminase large subunit
VVNGEHRDQQKSNEDAGPKDAFFDWYCSQESNHENSFSTVTQCQHNTVQSEETVSQEPVLLYTRNFGVWLQYNKDKSRMQQKHCFITTQCCFFLRQSC